METICKINLNDSNTTEIPGRIFHFWNCFYLDESLSYDAQKLNIDFRYQAAAYGNANIHFYQGFPTMVNQENNLVFGLWESPFEKLPEDEKSKKYTYLFFEENFYNCLEIAEKHKLKSIRIENNKFYYFPTFKHDVNLQKLTPNSFEVMQNCRKLKNELPHLIKVISPNITPSLTSEGFLHILSTFSVPKQQGGNTYIHHQFKNQLFHEVNTSSLNDLKIELWDQNNKKLRLGLGGKIIILF